MLRIAKYLGINHSVDGVGGRRMLELPRARHGRGFGLMGREPLTPDVISQLKSSPRANPVPVHRPRGQILF